MDTQFKQNIDRLRDIITRLLLSQTQHFRIFFVIYFLFHMMKRSYEGKGMGAELILPLFQNVIVRSRTIMPLEDRIKRFFLFFLFFFVFFVFLFFCFFVFLFFCFFVFLFFCFFVFVFHFSVFFFTIFYLDFYLDFFGFFFHFFSFFVLSISLRTFPPPFFESLLFLFSLLSSSSLLCSFSIPLSSSEEELLTFFMKHLSMAPEAVALATHAQLGDAIKSVCCLKRERGEKERGGEEKKRREEKRREEEERRSEE